NAAKNAAILAVEILAIGNETIAAQLKNFGEGGDAEGRRERGEPPPRGDGAARRAAAVVCRGGHASGWTV
ncbi:MAG: hypothetical protein KC543_13925, partial [Myxococcales bacterium]|nr:hypothetical protein [Myxococcales bacterium]